MAALKSLVLEGNPMKGIRRDIIQRGTTELKKYLRSRQEEPAPLQNGRATNGVVSSGGNTGVIGGSGDVDAHEVKASKALDYRYGILI